LTKIQQQTNDRLCQWYEREAQEMAEVRTAVGQLPVVLNDNGCYALAGVEMGQANDSLGADVTQLKPYVGVLEQDNRQLSEAKGLRPQNDDAPISVT
jgi:hypothetical protein